MATPIIIDVQANSQQAQSAIDVTNNKIKETEQITTDVTAKGAAKIGLFSALWTKALDGIASGLKTVVGWVKNSMDAEARLTAVHKATADASGITKDRLDALTQSMVNYTGKTREEVMNAQAVLLTFRKIGPESFDRAQKAAGDLAAVLKTDLKSAMIQIGKALEDPTNGVTALRRAGVSFTEDQLKQIKTLQQTNRLYEAQSFILKEIEGQVGGTAPAVDAADAIGTAKARLQDAIAKIGRFFAPIASAIGNIITSISEAFDAIVESSTPVKIALGAIAVTVLAIFSPVTLVVGAIAALVAIFGQAGKSVIEVDTAVNDSMKSMLKLEQSQKTFNKTMDSGIDKLRSLTKGTETYKSTVEDLLNKYPDLVKYGISTASSIEDITIAQSKMNQEMKDKSIIQAGEEYKKLTVLVEDSIDNLAKAKSKYDRDQSEANRQALNAAASSYDALKNQIERTGKLAGKSQADIKDAVTDASGFAAIAWRGSTKAMLDSLNNVSTLMQRNWREMLQTMTADEITKLQNTLKIQRTELMATRGLMEDLKAARLAQRAGGTLPSPTGLNFGTMADNFATALDEQTKKDLAELEQKEREVTERLRKLLGGYKPVSTPKTTGAPKGEKGQINTVNEAEELMKVINKGLGVANTVLGTLADGSKAIEERIFDSVMTIASQMGPQGQMVAGIMAVGKTLFNALKKSSKSALEQYREQLESITKEYQKQMESINASLNVAGKNDIALLEAAYQSAADASAAYFKSIGMANQSLSQEQLIEMQKIFNSFNIIDFGNSNTNKLMRNARELGRKMGVELVDGTGQATQELYSGRANRQQLLKMFDGLLPESLMDATVSALVGKTWHQVLTQTDDVLRRLKDSIKDGLELTSEQREAFISYQSAYTNQQIAELEHANKMGKYQDNDIQYQTDKIKLYDNLISVLKEEIDTNGANYQLQMQLWGLEEERYSMQQAINQAKGVELGLTRNLNSEYMRGQMGFAQHYRNMLASNLSNAGLSNLTLGNSPSVVYVNGSGGSAGDTTNYIINGVNFRNPAEAVNEMNNQKLYQTGRSWF